MTEQLYADVILPLAAPPMTFAVEGEVAGKVMPGSRVMVSLGPRKFYAGVVLRLHTDRPDFKRIKPIERLIDPSMAVSAEQLRLWEWMAGYYMCPIGIVMRGALPAKLKPVGLSVSEALDGGFRPRTTPHLTLSPAIKSEEDLHKVLDSLKRARAQHKAVIDYLDKAEIDWQGPGRVCPPIPRQDIEATPAVIKALTEKGIFNVEHLESEGNTHGKMRLGDEMPELTPAQAEALAKIKRGFSEKEAALLHGITGSGKTEIYIRLIAEALAEGKNVLYMLPEISLTAQLIGRMQRFFTDAVVVYHSRLSDGRRAEVYRSLLCCEGGKLIIGVRSSVLLPTPNLSLVIIDEEHDGSFKQSDNAPRYHARDTALMLASLYGAKTLLGSATPSVESYFNAVSGKYAHIKLGERYSGVSMPKIIVSDTMRAARRGERISHFTKTLLENIDTALAEKRQVILFQNRRGYSPYVECGSCGWTGGCPHCNVTLTYHRSDSSLRCHYCGHTMQVPVLCPSCGHGDLLPRGFGTEKIEQELAAIYPDAAIDRLDADTSRTAGSYQRVVGRFEQGQTDILIGTQMITKGFDFAGVSLVGILNADNMLNYPDFRASERAFSTMMQVGGRAGRRDTQGTVVIQTSQPENPTIGQVLGGNYEIMAAAALAERRCFLYPPYCRLITVTIRHDDHSTAWQCAADLAAQARPVFGRRLLGPEAPPVDRIRGKHLVRFILKIEKGSSPAKAKKLLQAMLDSTAAKKEFRQADFIVDVDPV